MEAATAAPDQAPPAPAPEPEAPPPVEEEAPTPVAPSPPAEENVATERVPGKLFKYSDFVHVGEDALDCSHREDGECDDLDHFHAWIRLPNQFQHDVIRKKALAAKARIVRQLNDPETDGYTVLQADLDAMRLSGDKAALVEDLANREFLKNHMEATTEVREDEAFSTIEEDIARFKVLEGMTADDRPHDEYTELTTHIQEYHQRIDAARDALAAPLKEALEGKEFEDLVRMVRDERIEAEGTEEFMRAFSKWTWVTCTLKPRPKEQGRPNEQVWKDLAPMLQEPQEVLESLDAHFAGLEDEVRAKAGNS